MRGSTLRNVIFIPVLFVTLLCYDQGISQFGAKHYAVCCGVAPCQGTCTCTCLCHLGTKLFAEDFYLLFMS